MHHDGYIHNHTHRQANSYVFACVYIHDFVFKDSLQINAIKYSLNVFLKDSHQQRGCTEPFQIPQTPYPALCSALPAPVPAAGEGAAVSHCFPPCGFHLRGLGPNKAPEITCDVFPYGSCPSHYVVQLNAKVANLVQRCAGILSPKGILGTKK